ncbi:MAG: hypothetical protein IJ157_14540 [Clostridia bacterium]|nr:hypothetical protein [Clostridia bacterium]
MRGDKRFRRYADPARPDPGGEGGLLTDSEEMKAMDYIQDELKDALTN